MNRNVLSAYQNSPKTSFANDFLLNVAAGLVPGHDFVDKFGENPDIDTGTPEDVWEGGGTYTYDADGTAPIVSIVSDEDTDTGQVKIQGLDIDGLLVTQTATLNGTTRVPLAVPLWRVFRMRNEAASDLDGTVYVYASTDAAPLAGDIRAVLGAANQTLMSIYTIPADKVGFLLGEEVGLSRANVATFMQYALKVRPFGKAFQTKRRLDLITTGTSVDRNPRIFPLTIPGKTDIKQTIESVSANSTGAFGTFQILLVDADRLPLTFLNQIGHPS